MPPRNRTKTWNLKYRGQLGYTALGWGCSHLGGFPRCLSKSLPAESRSFTSTTNSSSPPNTECAAHPTWAAHFLEAWEEAHTVMMYAPRNTKAPNLCGYGAVGGYSDPPSVFRLPRVPRDVNCSSAGVEFGLQEVWNGKPFRPVDAHDLHAAFSDPPVDRPLCTLGRSSQHLHEVILKLRGSWHPLCWCLHKRLPLRRSG